MNTKGIKGHETDTFMSDILSTVRECDDLYVMKADSAPNSNKKSLSLCEKQSEKIAAITWDTQRITGLFNYNDLMKNAEIWLADVQEMENLFHNQAQEMTVRDSTIINNYSLLEKLMMAVTESTYRLDNMDILLNLIDRDFGRLENSVSCLECITPYQVITIKDISNRSVGYQIFCDDLKRQQLFNGIYEYFSVTEIFKDRVLEVERCLEDLDYNEPGEMLLKLIKVNCSMQSRMRIQLQEMEMLCSEIAENTSEIYARAELCRSNEGN